MSERFKVGDVVYRAEYDPDTGYAGVRFVPMRVCSMRVEDDGVVYEVLCETADGQRGWMSCHGTRPPRTSQRLAVVDLLDRYREDARDSAHKLSELHDDIEALEAALLEVGDA